MGFNPLLGGPLIGILNLLNLPSFYIQGNGLASPGSLLGWPPGDI